VTCGDPYALLDCVRAGGDAPENSAGVRKLSEKIAGRAIGPLVVQRLPGGEDIDLSPFDCGRIYIMPESIRERSIFDLYRRIEGGDLVEDTLLKVHIPSVYDQSLGPPGISIVRIETDMSIEPFDRLGRGPLADEMRRSLEQQIASGFVRRVEDRLIPGLRGKTVYSRVISPVGWRDLFLSRGGSGTGWAHTVQNYFKDVFPTRTDLDGIFIVGQWGELSSGIRQLILSARKAASEILRRG